MRDTGAICFQFRTHDSAPSPRGPGNLFINTLGEGCGGTKRGRTGPNEFLPPPTHSEIYPQHTAACLTGGPVLAVKPTRDIQKHPRPPPAAVRGTRPGRLSQALRPSRILGRQWPDASS